MKYKGNVIEAIFVKRPNRFIAHVIIDGVEEVVHVKNTGRCKELLLPGGRVLLEEASNPNRKTKYSLIAVYKEDLLINMDSQIPNNVVFEAVKTNLIKEIPPVDFIKAEKTYGNSRFDIYYESSNQKGFIEVKGVTLEDQGYLKFPDAPTTRGEKHVRELIVAEKDGYKNYIFFLAQFQGGKEFSPNWQTDPKFSQALVDAKKTGVTILCYDSIVKSDEIIVGKSVKIVLE